MGQLRIAIVGCGTAGPASALLLARQGHAVTLLDKAPTLEPVGAGLLLQPSGLSVLRSLGLLAKAVSTGSVVHTLRGRLPCGKTVLSLRYADLRQDLFGLGIGRPALLHTLLGAALASGAALQTGRHVERIEQSGAEARLWSAQGECLGAFDLVLVCDGARSILVDRVGIPVRARTYRWGALWTIGHAAPGTAGSEPGVLEQVYDSTTTLIGTLPSGRLEGGQEAISLFYSTRTDQFDSVRTGDLRRWAERVGRVHPLGGHVAQQVTEPTHLLPAVYREVVMPRWDQGRVCILGDAAHALSPLLGMGANMALVDARQFALSLESHGPSGAGTHFSRQRLASVHTYQRICRWMTPMYQSDWPVLSVLRNAIVPLLCGWGWSRRHALHIVAGVQRGLVSADPLPPMFEPVSTLLMDQR